MRDEKHSERSQELAIEAREKARQAHSIVAKATLLKIAETYEAARRGEGHDRATDVDPGLDQSGCRQLHLDRPGPRGARSPDDEGRDEGDVIADAAPSGCPPVSQEFGWVQMAGPVSHPPV